MIEYDVGDIIRNTHFKINMLILKKEAGGIGGHTCLALLLSKGTEKHHYIGATIRWAGWPNSNGPWSRLA
jgi:hypothetical protein